MAHIPVLLQLVVAHLDPKPGETYLDATLGSGGHAFAIGQIVGKEGRVIALDQDATSLEKGRDALKSLEAQVDFKLANFRNIDTVLAELEVKEVDKILFDLGVHSDQIGSSGRGFSFMYDEPLLMTMGEVTADKLTAGDIVNFWTKEDISNVLTGYGEEQFSESIAEAIVKYRRDTPIKTTFQLVEIIKDAVPAWYKHKKIHPATKTFQALRIAVNDELDALREGLGKAFAALSSGGRLAVISFHSLEAKIVKDFFKTLSKEGAGKLVNKHALRPTWAETRENPRSRSAQLRVIEKI